MRVALTDNEHYLFEAEIVGNATYLHLSYKKWCKTAHKRFTKEFAGLVKKYDGAFYVYRTERPSEKFLQHYGFERISIAPGGEIWERKLNGKRSD